MAVRTENHAFRDFKAKLFFCRFVNADHLPNGDLFQFWLKMVKVQTFSVLHPAKSATKRPKLIRYRIKMRNLKLSLFAVALSFFFYVVVVAPSGRDSLGFKVLISIVLSPVFVGFFVHLLNFWAVLVCVVPLSLLSVELFFVLLVVALSLLFEFLWISCRHEPNTTRFLTGSANTGNIHCTTTPLKGVCLYG